MLGGCKPRQLMNERYVTVTDSTSVLKYSDSLQIKEWQMYVLRTQFNRFIEENFNLLSETSSKEIYYDTNAVIDSVSGRHPILSEVITTNIVSIDKAKRDSVVLLCVDTIEISNINSLKSNASLKIDRSIDENKSVETEPVCNTSLRYIMVCLVVLFIVLATKNV
jgi:hypothetical protein